MPKQPGRSTAWSTANSHIFVCVCQSPELNISLILGFNKLKKSYIKKEKKITFLYQKESLVSWNEFHDSILLT